MSNLEDIFKSSLENAEMPYAPAAWESMQAMLDQRMPVKATKPTFKWGWVASVVVVGTTVLTYTLWPAADTTAAQEKAQVARTTESPAVSSAQAAQLPQQTTAEKTTALENNAEQTMPAVRRTPVAGGRTMAVSGENPAKKIPADEQKAGLETIIAKLAPIAGSPNQGNPIVKVIFPKVNASYCEGDLVQLRNNHNTAFMLVGEQGYSEFLDARNTQEFALNESGNYYFQYAEGGTVKKEFAFRVLPAPKADFTFDDDQLYEAGLPATPCKAMYAADSYSWSTENGLILSSEREFKARLYTKGNHELTLTVKDENGCENKVSRTINIPVDYNLIAMDGFDPFSSDSKNIGFMPYALTERNVSFQLIIVDPQDGSVLYKTMDAHKSWDGTDSRTGQMVPSGKAYAWKVTIYDPEPFERPEYKGTIIRK